MRHLRLVSVVMVLGGLLALAAAAVLGLGGVWALTGLLLAWAGIVKVVVVAIWQRTIAGEPEPTGPSRR